MAGKKGNVRTAKEKTEASSAKKPGKRTKAVKAETAGKKDYGRLTKFLPVLENDETLYDEEEGCSDVIFRFMENLYFLCEEEPDNKLLLEMKDIFDREESDPGVIFRNLDVIIRDLKEL